VDKFTFSKFQMAAALGLLAAAGIASAGVNGTVDLHGKAEDPFASTARARVFIYVRTDCPLTDRYAPELTRIASEFAARHVQFWLVYPDPAETVSGIETQLSQYKLPGTPLRDPHHQLVSLGQATVSPEAAVFNQAGQLVYSGRIDDRYVDFGRARAEARTHDLENAITATLDGKPVAESKTRAIGCYLADVK
jgi:hypothetical protein